jgi:excisionase family DNA binding protein
MEQPGDLIGTSEVCALLGVDRSTVKRWVDRERLKPAGKMPGATGAYLFRRGDVLALKDS